MHFTRRLPFTLILALALVVLCAATAPVLVKYWKLRMDAARAAEALTSHGLIVLDATPCMRKFEGVVMNVETDVDKDKITTLLRHADITQPVEITIHKNGTIVDQFLIVPRRE